MDEREHDPDDCQWFLALVVLVIWFVLATVAIDIARYWLR